MTAWRLTEHGRGNVGREIDAESYSEAVVIARLRESERPLLKAIYRVASSRLRSL